LILGDELCSGTENVSAISIFVAGIQQLYKKRCSFIFATHFHEIVNYEEIVEMKDTLSIKHMEVIYDREKDDLVYDRKLKNGSGTNRYGLEVCKSLHLPEDFLDMAQTIRSKYFPDTGTSLLSLGTSHFNSKKIVSFCEHCKKNMGTEVHHLQHQSSADDKGFIKNNIATFHKNHAANLMTLCDECHKKFHQDKNTQHKKTKTGKGYKVSLLSDS